MNRPNMQVGRAAVREPRVAVLAQRDGSFHPDPVPPRSAVARGSPPRIFVFHLRAWRPVGPPRRRHANHHAGTFQVRDVSQKLNGLARRPPERVEDLASIHKGLQPRTGFRGSLHRQKQGQQPVLVCRARIFAQSLPQRKMLRLRIRRQPRGVGCQKGNGASGSLRFSARLKCTRPTRFHAGFRLLRKSCMPHFDSASSIPNAVSSSCHSAPSTSAVRYSAPVMGGTACASRPNSAAGGAGTRTFRGARSVSAWVQRAVTYDAPNSRQ